MDDWLINITNSIINIIISIYILFIINRHFNHDLQHDNIYKNVIPIMIINKIIYFYDKLTFYYKNIYGLKY
jgi:hypothetical protein